MKDKLIDLHTHTIYSDGDLTPIELVELAKKNNIGTLAITDHNTILGVKNLIESNYNLNDINVIPGIELSAKVPKGQLHILGLNIDINNEILNKKMSELRTNSMNHFLSVLEQVKRDYGITFTYEEIKEIINKEHNLGRPDIARLCVKNGLASTISEAFDKYLVPSYNKIRGQNKGITYQECLDLIVTSGGIPVLAHPHTLELNDKEFLILLKYMINKGLRGIEIYHSKMSEEQRKLYLEYAYKYDLLISGGTDYHGISVKPNIKIGTGINNNVKVKQLSIMKVLKK